MFRNLDAELKRNGLTRGRLAELLKIRPTTLSNKLNGKSIITLNEANAIKSIIAPHLTLEELFKPTTDSAASEQVEGD